MRILITGANGHIGGALVRHFHALGEEVIATSRSPKRCLPEGVQFVQADLADSQFKLIMLQEIPEVDVLIHAAAELGGNAVSSFREVNAQGTEHLLELSTALKTRAFVYFSSMSVLDEFLILPISEEHPCNPQSSYGQSKLEGELFTLKHSDNFDTCVSLRITSPVGLGLRHPRIFRVFVEKALRNEDIVIHGSGGRRQNYVDERDIASAVEGAIKHQAKGVFNIGAEHSLSNLELARVCIKSLNSNSKITFSGESDPQENLDWNISLEKSKQILDFQPRYSIEDSIAALADEMRNEPSFLR